MLTLFLPFLPGYWSRLGHIVRGHRNVGYTDRGRWAEAHCSCGGSWLESWAL